jgi:hypothetical protein
MRLLKHLPVFAAAAALLTCAQNDGRIGRINPLDPGGTNYHPPTVTASAQPATVAVGDSVTVTASAHDANGTIRAIYWALDGVHFSDVPGDSVVRIACQSAGESRILVKAVDNDLLESSIDTVVILVKGNAPIPISPQDGATVALLRPSLSWRPGVYADWYQVLLDTASAPATSAIDSTTDTFFTVSQDLERGTTCFWRVIGFTAGGLSDTSAAWSFAAPDTNAVVLESGLMAWFPFNGNAHDAGGYNNSTWVSGATLAADRFGKAGKAFAFSRTDFIEVVDPAILDFADADCFTLSVWCKTTSDSSFMFPMIKHQGGYANGYFIAVNHASQGFCGGPGVPSFFVASLAGNDACASGAINDGAWHHLAAVYSGVDNSTTLIVDGVVQSRHGTRGAPIHNTLPLKIGTGFIGSLDDIRIYKRILIPAEIDSLFHEGGWTGP